MVQGFEKKQKNNRRKIPPAIASKEFNKLIKKT